MSIISTGYFVREDEKISRWATLLFKDNDDKMYNSKIKYLKARPGERYASALTKISLNDKIIRRFGKIKLKDYVSSFIKG